MKSTPLTAEQVVRSLLGEMKENADRTLSVGIMTQDGIEPVIGKVVIVTSDGGKEETTFLGIELDEGVKVSGPPSPDEETITVPIEERHVYSGGMIRYGAHEYQDDALKLYVGETVMLRVEEEDGTINLDEGESG